MSLPVASREYFQAMQEYMEAVAVYQRYISTRTSRPTDAWYDQAKIYQEIMLTCRLIMLYFRPNWLRSG